MKTIVPYKLIVGINPDGTAGSTLLQYRICVDGSVEEKFYTVTVNDGINAETLNSILASAKTHAETGEGLR